MNRISTCLSTSLVLAALLPAVIFGQALSSQSLTGKAHDDAELIDEFGRHVSIDHEGYVYVGEPSARVLEGSGVYIYRQDASESWVAHDTLRSLEIADDFGQVSVRTGDYLFVGAPRSGDTGAVYVFHRDGTDWEPQGKLPASGLRSGARFGESLAAHDDVLVVGAPFYDFNSGAVFVYRLNGSWEQEIRLLNPRRDDGLFGWGIAVVDGQILVGAQYTDEQNGLVHVFQHQDGVVTWAKTQELFAAGATGGGRFGRSLSADGTLAVIGAPGANDYAGAAYVYAFDSSSGQWLESETLADPAGAAGAVFGWSVSIDDDSALVSGYNKEEAPLFARDPATGKWTVAASLENPTDNPFGPFGYSVDLEGDMAIVGAPGIERAVVYERAAEEWTLSTAFVGGTSSLQRISGPVACTGGKASHFSCSSIDLMSFLPTHEIGGDPSTALNDIWGWTDPETGKEYAIVGRTDGTAFVDVTEPTNPVYLGNLPTRTTASTWRDVKVYDHYALVVADNVGSHGIQIFDLQQLRNVGSPPVEFTETARYGGISSAHNIVVNQASGHAFAVGMSGPQNVPAGAECGRGYHGVDLSDPLNPVFAGCFNSTVGRGYTHDAQCVRYKGPDSDYAGRDICFGADEQGISIADLTDPGSGVQIASATYPNVAYAHQGWLTEDHRTFFLGDEIDERSGLVSRTRTLIFDVEDLDDPVLAGEYFGPTGAIDHNLYTHDGKLFEANYAAGLRILDLGTGTPLNPAAIEEVGFFDVLPQNDAASFSGAWSSYPFFESGTVVVSGMESGLFVLRPTGRAHVARERRHEVPRAFSISAFPNPFTAEVSVKLVLDSPQRISVTVHDVLGRRVALLHEGFLEGGAAHVFGWDASELAGGAYWVRVRGESLTRALPLIRTK